MENPWQEGQPKALPRPSCWQDEGSDSRGWTLRPSHGHWGPAAGSEGHCDREKGWLQPEQRPQALEVSHRRLKVSRREEVLWQVLHRKHQSRGHQVCDGKGSLNHNKDYLAICYRALGKRMIALTRQHSLTYLGEVSLYKSLSPIWQGRTQ